MEWVTALASRVRYGGNPEHKKNPGDFGLDPPTAPRAGKTLCDPTGILSREEAEGLLRRGVERGLVSVQRRGEWPQNVWAATDLGDVLEAQLDNEVQGSYHGYPLPPDDPFREEVLRRWRR